MNRINYDHWFSSVANTADSKPRTPELLFVDTVEAILDRTHKANFAKVIEGARLGFDELQKSNKAPVGVKALAKLFDDTAAKTNDFLVMKGLRKAIKYTRLIFALLFHRTTGTQSSPLDPLCMLNMMYAKLGPILSGRLHVPAKYKRGLLYKYFQAIATNLFSGGDFLYDHTKLLQAIGNLTDAYTKGLKSQSFVDALRTTTMTLANCRRTVEERQDFLASFEWTTVPITQMAPLVYLKDHTILIVEFVPRLGVERPVKPEQAKGHHTGFSVRGRDVDDYYTDEETIDRSKIRETVETVTGPKKRELDSVYRVNDQHSSFETSSDDDAKHSVSYETETKKRAVVKTTEVIEILSSSEEDETIVDVVVETTKTTEVRSSSESPNLLLLSSDYTDTDEDSSSGEDERKMPPVVETVLSYSSGGDSDSLTVCEGLLRLKQADELKIQTLHEEREETNKYNDSFVDAGVSYPNYEDDDHSSDDESNSSSSSDDGDLSQLTQDY